MFDDLVDVKENKVLSFSYDLLKILLKDNSSNKNIIWGTNNYIKHGIGFSPKDFITPEKITGYYGNIIKPRTEKTAKEKLDRIKNQGEVFTPSWICNKQNNLIDSEWFTKQHVFNREIGTTWKTIKRKIEFPEGKNWELYVKLKKLEISCGEAPYIVSRYDSVTGEIIPINNRIGILDRKFRIINENVKNDIAWIEWSKIAIKTVYGYDIQGDNVLLARENILYSYSDYYYERFHKKPTSELILEIAKIISWNIWQMDGLNFIVPFSCKTEEVCQFSFFDVEIQKIECIGCKTNNYNKHNGIYSKIMNWDTNRTNKFVNLINRGKEVNKYEK